MRVGAPEWNSQEKYKTNCMHRNGKKVGGKEAEKRNERGTEVLWVCLHDDQNVTSGILMRS